MGAPKPKEFLDRDGTLAKCPDKVRLRDGPAVDQLGDADPVGLAKSSDPHAPGIVDMSRDHPEGAAGCAGDYLVTDRGRQANEE